MEGQRHRGAQRGSRGTDNSAAPNMSFPNVPHGIGRPRALCVRKCLPREIFVQKARATTLGTLAQALRELANRNNEVKIIGTRHGEKLYESLVSREEMARCEDPGSSYRIPAASRGLNCNKHFVDGETQNFPD